MKAKIVLLLSCCVLLGITAFQQAGVCFAYRNPIEAGLPYEHSGIRIESRLSRLVLVSTTGNPLRTTEWLPPPLHLDKQRRAVQ